MTIPELLGTAAAGLTGALAAYRKLEGLIGKKEGKSDGSIRDLLLRLEGKVEAHHEFNARELVALNQRVGRVEAEVFNGVEPRPMFRSDAE